MSPTSYQTAPPRVTLGDSYVSRLGALSTVVADFSARVPAFRGALFCVRELERGRMSALARAWCLQPCYRWLARPPRIRTRPRARGLARAFAGRGTLCVRRGTCVLGSGTARLVARTRRLVARTRRLVARTRRLVARTRRLVARTAQACRARSRSFVARTRRLVASRSIAAGLLALADQVTPSASGRARVCVARFARSPARAPASRSRVARAPASSLSAGCSRGPLRAEPGRSRALGAQASRVRRSHSGSRA